MGVKHFNLPDPGEGLLEAEIVEWKVNVGDTVKVNDIVVEIETAKSLVELPIPWAGTVTALLVNVGDEVEVGTPIIGIDDGKGGESGSAAPGPRPPVPSPRSRWDRGRLLQRSTPRSRRSRSRRSSAMAPRPVARPVAPASPPLPPPASAPASPGTSPNVCGSGA